MGDTSDLNIRCRNDSMNDEILLGFFNEYCTSSPAKKKKNENENMLKC